MLNKMEENLIILYMSTSINVCPFSTFFSVDGTSCHLHTFVANFIIHFLQISFFLSSYVIPLALICILYVGMLIRLWHSPPGSKVSAESRRGKKRVTRMVVFVVLGENF